MAYGDPLQTVRFDRDVAGAIDDAWPSQEEDQTTHVDYLGSAICYCGPQRGEGKFTLAIGAPYILAGDETYNATAGGVLLVAFNADGTLDHTDSDEILLIQQGDRDWSHQDGYGSALAYMGQFAHTANYFLAIGAPLAKSDAEANDYTGRIYIVSFYDNYPYMSQGNDSWVINSDSHADLGVFDVGGGNGGQLGQSLAYLGDIDGSGRVVLATGSTQLNGTNGSVVLLYLKRPYALWPSGNEYPVDACLFIDESHADATALGITYHERFGQSVASCGDMLGNGGHVLAVTSGRYGGRIRLIYLNPAGDGSIDDVVLLDYPVTGSSSKFGSSISYLGDIAGDGSHGILIGDVFADGTTEDQCGAAWIAFVSDDGTLLSYTDRISQGSTNGPDNNYVDLYGHASCGVPNVGEEKRTWIAVGAPQDDVVTSSETWPGANSGAVWLSDISSIPVRQFQDIPIISDTDDSWTTNDAAPVSQVTYLLFGEDASGPPGNELDTYMTFRTLWVPKGAACEDVKLQVFGITGSVDGTEFTWAVNAEVSATQTTDADTLDVDAATYMTGFTQEFEDAVADAGWSAYGNVGVAMNHVTDNAKSSGIWSHDGDAATLGPRLFYAFTPVQHATLDTNNAESRSENLPTDAVAPLVVNDAESRSENEQIDLNPQLVVNNAESRSENSQLPTPPVLDPENLESRSENLQLPTPPVTDPYSLESRSENEQVGYMGVNVLKVNSSESRSENSTPQLVPGQWLKRGRPRPRLFFGGGAFAGKGNR